MDPEKNTQFKTSFRVEPPINYYDMIDLAEENKRISEQVTSMSTQLMESISKQSELEEKLNHATRKAATLQQDAEKYADLKTKYEFIETQLSKTQEQLTSSKNHLTEETKLRNEAEEMVKQLEGEVEDLTASLFAEANNMVADARREKHTTEILNRKLLEAVKEKDNALETLKAQLKHMKRLVEKMEPDSASIYSSSNQIYSVGTSDNDNMSIKKTPTSTSFQSEIVTAPSVIYSPNISAVRYDLNLYTEFLKFIALLPSCKSIRDTANESKLLRRLNNDEISPILKIDSAPGIGLWTRKTLLNAMIDGLVVTEPLTGLTETFQFGYASPSLNKLSDEIFPSSNKPSDGKLSSSAKSSEDKPHGLFKVKDDSAPLAWRESCALCGECRNDNLVHARMHDLKVQTKETNGKLVVQNSYPLCLWCVSRVRQTCDIYAFLRSLKLGNWNLEKVTLKNGTVSEAVVSKAAGSPKSPSKAGKKFKKEEIRSKRMSFMGGLGINTLSHKSKPQVESTSKISMERIGQPNSNIERAWLQLCKLRSMLHWSHIGVWSINDSVCSKIGPASNQESDDDDDYEKVSFLDVNSESIATGDVKSSGIDSILSNTHSSVDQPIDTAPLDNTKKDVHSSMDEENKITDATKDANPDIKSANQNSRTEQSTTEKPASQGLVSEEHPVHAQASQEPSAEVLEEAEVGEETKESIDIIGEYHEGDDPNEQSSETEEDDTSVSQFADAQEKL